MEGKTDEEKEGRLLETLYYTVDSKYLIVLKGSY